MSALTLVELPHEGATLYVNPAQVISIEHRTADLCELRLTGNTPMYEIHLSARETVKRVLGA